MANLKTKFLDGVVGVAIAKKFDDIHKELFHKFKYPKMEQTKAFSFEEIIIKKLIIGEKPEEIIIGNIRKGTLIFNMEIFCNDSLLEQISWRTTLLKFHINKSTEILYFGLYENGKCIRDNYADETIAEIGTPLAVEKTLTDKSEVIISLVNETLDTNIFEYEKHKFYSYKRQQSFLSKLFR